MNSPGARTVPRSPSRAPGVQEPAATLPVKRAPVEPTSQAAGNTPAVAARQSAAAGDTKQPSEPGREVPGSEGDEQQAAREWADQKAAEIGLIWLSRFPAGKDWV